MTETSFKMFCIANFIAKIATSPAPFPPTDQKGTEFKERRFHKKKENNK